MCGALHVVRNVLITKYLTMHSLADEGDTSLRSAENRHHLFSKAVTMYGQIIQTTEDR